MDGDLDITNDELQNIFTSLANSAGIKTGILDPKKIIEGLAPEKRKEMVDELWRGSREIQKKSP